MSETVQTGTPAWEPLSPMGVAAFTRASVKRLLLVQLLMAIVASGVLVWFLAKAWFPVVQSAVAALPAAGQVRSGNLEWGGAGPVTPLAGNAFLGFAVDLTHSGRAAHGADLQVEFGRKDWRLVAAPGYYAAFEYPPDWSIAFNRAELEPWWGAWRPWLLAGAPVAAILALMVTWLLLATIYCVPGWFIAFLADRELTLTQSWRLAGASLMPGAMFLTCALAAYALGWVDLPQLGALWLVHFLIGWAYLVISPLFLPRSATPEVRANPFATRPQSKPVPEPGSPPEE